MYDHGMIAPVVALVIWSLIMLIWLYATRIPAMSKAKLRPGQATKSDMDALPVANVANNYNHLMEQPTLFYAICFSLQFLGQGEHPINIGLAWLYVAIRVIHSLVQATVNIIIVRFLIFIAASLVLGALTFHAAIASGLAWFNLPG
ncbi:MAG: MAPEG family protein [Hyphomonadaceae bacterium]